jgi:hypothetical protein
MHDFSATLIRYDKSSTKRASGGNGSDTHLWYQRKRKGSTNISSVASVGFQATLMYLKKWYSLLQLLIFSIFTDELNLQQMFQAKQY